MRDKKPVSPFPNFDMAQFDFGKIFTDLKWPGVDMETMMAAHRKNLEALVTANQRTLAGLQTIAQRQTQMLTEAMAEAAKAAQTLAQSASPQELTAKQTELVKTALQKTLTDMRELAEIVQQSNTEAFDVINERFKASLGELQALLGKNT
ncbi:MAG: TIGR01841 family phasin [Gammaproteobacteria bacterium]